MKQIQTFKFDPDLLTDLKSEAVTFNTPFNRYVETLLSNHPYRLKSMYGPVKSNKKKKKK